MVDSLIRWLNVHIDLVFKLCRDQKAQSPAAFLIIMLSRLVDLKRQFLFGARFSYIKWSMALSWLDSCTLVLVDFLVSILEQWFSPTPTCRLVWIWAGISLASHQDKFFQYPLSPLKFERRSDPTTNSCSGFMFMWSHVH